MAKQLRNKATEFNTKIFATGEPDAENRPSVEVTPLVHGLSPLKIEVKGDMSSVRQACRVMACVARQTPKTYPRGMPPSYAKTLALESLQKDCPPAYDELMKKEKLYHEQRHARPRTN